MYLYHAHNMATSFYALEIKLSEQRSLFCNNYKPELYCERDTTEVFPCFKTSLNLIWHDTV